MSFVIGGYYQSWKVYSTCTIADINPTLCTLMFYAFAGVHTDGSLQIDDQNADITLGGYKKFNALKEQNPHLKTLLSVGGWSLDPVLFSNMARSADTRKNFIDSSLNFMQTYGFDGIDIDWEYPGQRGGIPEDKGNFVQLLKEMRDAFKDKHLLIATVGAGQSTVDTSYDVAGISKYVDYINVMTYDLHTSEDGKTGANAPLHSNDNLNVQSCIKYWLSKGANPKKVVLGTGSYGQSYTLCNPSDHGIGAPSCGPGKPGSITNSEGTLSYVEIEQFLKQGWTKVNDQEQQIPYAYHENQWVGYDDVDSIQKKVQLAKQYNLAGVMMWSVDQDDPRGLTGSRYPLLNAINQSKN